MAATDDAPGTAIEKYFFTPLYHPHSAWSVVRWWEARRPLFNVAVGSAGLLSMATSLAVGGLPDDGMWVFGIVVYGVMANICYTLGPVADLGLRKLLGNRAPAAGPVLFRYGFVFAMGLTLLPIPLVLIGRLLKFLFS